MLLIFTKKSIIFSYYIIKMSQISPCLLGSGFLMASVYTMMSKGKSAASTQFEASLNSGQQQIYEQIKEERAKLYFRGLALGTVLGAAFLYFNRGGLTAFGSGAISNACLFTVIVMGTMTFFYKLSPKSKWMVEYLTTTGQVQLWNAVYKEMQYKYYMGFFLGLAGYVLIGYALSLGFGSLVDNTLGNTLGQLPVVGDFVPQVGEYLEDFF